MKPRIFSNIFFRQTSKEAAATRVTVCVIPQTVSSSILVLVLYMYLSALGQNGRARLAIKTKGLVKRLGLWRRAAATWIIAQVCSSFFCCKICPVPDIQGYQIPIRVTSPGLVVFFKLFWPFNDLLIVNHL